MADRNLQLLQGTLLTFKDAKLLILAYCDDRVAQKDAIGRVYRLSGGNKWLRRDLVERIAEEANERAAASRETKLDTKTP